MEEWQKRLYEKAKKAGYEEAAGNIKTGIKVPPQTTENRGVTEKGYMEGRNQAIKDHVKKWKAGELPDPIPRNTKFVEGSGGKIMEVVKDPEAEEQRKEQKKKDWRERISSWKETQLA